MKQFLRLGEGYARKVTQYTVHIRKQSCKPPLYVRPFSVACPLLLDTRPVPAPHLTRTGSAISSVLLRSFSAASSVLLRCFSAAPPLLKRRTYGKQADNKQQTTNADTRQVPTGYSAVNDTHRVPNEAEADKAVMPFLPSPCAGPASAALPSGPIPICVACISLKRPNSGTLAKVWRINSGIQGGRDRQYRRVGSVAGLRAAWELGLDSELLRVGLGLVRPNQAITESSIRPDQGSTKLRSRVQQSYTKDKGRTKDFSCVQTPAKAPALPGLGLAMGIMFSLLCLSVFAQEHITVSGKVTAVVSDRPIEGATVTNKRTQVHVATDNQGEYSIAANSDDVLIYTFMGYKGVEEGVDGRTAIAVALEAAANTLDETVVIAYGTTSRRLNTGNVGRVTAETIAKQPVGNPLLALAGRVPGLEINQTNGLPGSSVNVRIRGRNSIQQGNEPMYIIDGVPWLSTSLTQFQTRGAAGDISPFNSINPADIESIEVLKDADATAIYGSRGANGVILITTKRGSVGKTSLDVNMYTGFGKVTRTMELMNTQQYLEMRREAFRNDGVEPTLANAPDLLLWDATRYVDWKKLMIGNTARVNDVQLALSGGSEGTQFRLGGSYRRETTVFPGDDQADQRGSAQLNVTHRSADDRLQANVNVGYSHNENDLIASDLTGQIYTPPNQPAYGLNNELIWNENGSSFTNPLRLLNQENNSQTKNFISNLSLQYEVGKGFIVRTTGGYTETGVSSRRITPNSFYGPSSSNQNWASSRFGTSNSSSWIIEPQLEFSTTIKESKFGALFGMTWQQQANRNANIDASDYSNEALLGSINGAASLINTSSQSLYRYQSLFARLNYNHQGKYLVNLTARRDGSSRFGMGRQYANFGAVGAAWIFSEEHWAKEGSGIWSFGKLRASYGITGSDHIGNYQYLDTYGATNPYQGIRGLFPNRLFNPDYAWETNRKLESAFDLGFLNDRILVSVALFRNRSGNQLLQDALPTQVGFPNITRNLPALVQNTGWEFELNAVPIQRPNFSWSFDFNLTLSRNKLLDYPGLAESNNALRYEVGKPLDIVRLWNYTGVDPTTGLYTFDMETGQTVFYDVTPQYYGGWNHTLTYRGFEASIFFQFIKQEKMNGLATLIDAPGQRYNIPIFVDRRWQETGDVTDIQRYARGGDAGTVFSQYRSSTASYTDASFFRLKNLSLAYQFTDLSTSNWIVNRCRVYLQCQNLLTLTSYVGNDPETGNANILPPLRMVTMGIQITL